MPFGKEPIGDGRGARQLNIGMTGAMLDGAPQGFNRKRRAFKAMKVAALAINQQACNVGRLVPRLRRLQQQMQRLFAERLRGSALISEHGRARNGSKRRLVPCLALKCMPT